MLVLQISGLVCYSVPLGYPLISARAIIIISTYAERKVSAPLGYSFWQSRLFVKSITLSHISNAAGRCVTITTVLSVILLRFCRSFLSVSESSAEVASSRSSVGLSEYIALAIAIRYICPSDKPVPRSPSRVSIPLSSSDTKS